MKKLALSLVAALLLGSLFTNASARRTPEQEFKKCCQKVKKSVKQALAGPSFEYLQPDNFEELDLICVIDENNTLKVKDVIGADEKLKAYVREELAKENIKCNPKLAGKTLKFDLSFYHRPS